MKDVTFRAWCPETCKMFMDVVVSGDDVIKLNYHDDGEFITESYDYISGCIIMQYTGCYDSKGVDICEGDVIACDYDSVYDPHGLKYPHVDKVEYILIEFDTLFDVPDIPRECVIVGNIYEQPELLLRVD